MINKIDNTSFQGRFHLNGYSKHTPKSKPYDEFYFMPQLQNQNPIKKFLKNVIEKFKSFFEKMHQQKDGHFEDIKNIKGTTIEI